MNVTQGNVLSLNYATRELAFKEHNGQKESRLNALVAVIATIIAWPLFLAACPILLLVTTSSYFQSKRLQSKMVKVLSDDNLLAVYGDERVRSCEKQIEKLQAEARLRMEQLKKPNELGLAIPQKHRIRDYLSPQLPEEYWQDFRWDEFLTTHVFQKFDVFSNHPDASSWKQLETIRLKLNGVMHQREVLSALDGRDRLNAIKRIAEFSIVKNSYRRQQSKEWTLHFIIWMLPGGLAWDLIFRSSNDRLIYEGKKDLLPSTTDLRNYKDLVDAHNRLVTTYDYLVPYFPGT